MSLETSSRNKTYSNESTFTYLAELDLFLQGHVNSDEVPEYTTLLAQLDGILKQMLNSEAEKAAKTKPKKAPEMEPVAASVTGDNVSLNTVKLLSRNLVRVLEKLPSKVYDLANTLLGELGVDDDGQITASGQIACVVLIDVLESYPLQVASLINFAATQIHKILKKDPLINSDILFLLGAAVKAASKSDVDDKLSAKLVKLASKTITQNSIMVGGAAELAADSPENGACVAAVANYVVLLKHLLTLQVSSHYETLLEISASSTSGTKLKPEALMAQQHSFQQAVLAAHEKTILFGLSSQFTEVRSATVDLLGHVLISFVATGKFSAVEYLLALYPMPDLNSWDETMTRKGGVDSEPVLEVRREKNLLFSHESEAIIGANLSALSLQTGVAEAFVAYVQLESLQDKDFLASSLTGIIDQILLKFGALSDPQHVQNNAWVRVLDQWTHVIEYLISECGSSSHDTLARYVIHHFTASQEETSRANSPDPRGSNKEKRRESLFGFKALKKSKKKGADRGPVNLYTNAYQLRLVLGIVSVLLPYGVDFNALMQTKSDDNFLDDGAETVDEDENNSTTKRNSYVSDLLLSLLANDSAYIRNYSLVCLLDYAQANRSESNRLSLEIFALVSQEFSAQSSKEPSALPAEKNTTKSSTTRLLSYSLALSALLKQADITMLQNSTVAKLLSFCTQNLKHTSTIGSKNTKNGACWIVLSALVTFYHESEFVKLNSSQFLVFWKNLLTSQFVSTGLSGDSTSGDSADILQNLKLRSFSLLCLLNYISTVEVTPELAKHLQFLLIKSHKYLVYLESSVESVGLVTGFHPQAFNECDYNPNLVNDVLFSNHFDHSPLSIEHQLISLILYNKKIVMQGFAKIAHSLKGDINSSLVVLLVKVFADAKLFSRLTANEFNKEKGKTKSKQGASKVSHQDLDILFLEEDYNYNFGVTSKFHHTPNIDELCGREAPGDLSGEFSTTFASEFARGSWPISSVSTEIHRQKAAIESHATPEIHSWTSTFESMGNSAAAHSVNFDPTILILHRYSMRHAFSPTIVTSLVDLSIELFQLVFAGLSYKIQFSLLEQLRTSLTAKNVDPLRRKALMINVSVALHGLLTLLVKKNTAISEDLVMLLLEILDLVDTTNTALVSIGADSVGLAAHLLPRAKLEEVVATHIGKIVNDTSPYRRGRHVLSLARINQHSHLAFLEILDVVTQLTKDKHPVMAYYSLSAAAIIFENPLGNQALIEEVLESTYRNLVSDSFTVQNPESMYANLRSRYGLMDAMARLVNVCVTSLGPRVRDCSAGLKSKIFQMLLAASTGIGCCSMQELLFSVATVLEACKELVVFNSALTEGFTGWASGLAFSVVRANLKTGVGLISPTSVNSDEIFPFTTSADLSQRALISLVEMTKIGVHTLNKGTVNMAWTSMELSPCPELKSLISYWVDSGSEAQWFLQLTQLFNMSSRKLVGKFVEVNYQQKLLPLQQRHKKSHKEANVEFADEEAQNIVEDESEADDKYQPINWAFRSLIYDLLIKLLAGAKKKPQLVKSLEPKIQEIVRISFLGTTAPIVSIKLQGVDLLSRALEVFGHLEDPLYPGVSILEQQQAQIISALIPCFSSDSDVSVIVEAIDVSSKFINLPRINFYSKQRILKTMIYLLEEISSNKFLKFVHLESMAEYGRKAIQLAILNCWAVLNVNFSGSNGTMEPEFDQILKKYSKLLISLWILVLKELSNLKYNQPNSRELKLYNEYWLNFVGVLSLILERKPETVKTFLQEEEDSFFFVMFCQCSEALIKSQNVPEVLVSVSRLVKIPGLARTLFSDDVFGEVVDLLDRLILMEEDVETKCRVVDAVNILFASFSQLAESPSATTEKYFELLRVAMLPLFEIFPFLRQDFNAEDAASKLSLKRCNTESSLAMATKQFSVLAQMMQKFPDETRADLVACMLYLIAKFFEFGDDALIGVTLTFLKVIVAQARSINSGLLDPFMKIMKANGLSQVKLSKKNYTITMIILITVGDVALEESESEGFAQFLIDGISDKAFAATSIQSIKSVIHNTKSDTQTSARITKFILRSLLDALVTYETSEEVDTRIRFEIVFLFTQSPVIDTEEKATAFFGLLVPLLLDYDGKSRLSKEYLHDKMSSLMTDRTDSFKAVVREHLDESQRNAAESLIKYSGDRGENGENGEIRLKSFA